MNHGGVVEPGTELRRRDLVGHLGQQDAFLPLRIVVEGGRPLDVQHVEVWRRRSNGGGAPEIPGE